MYPGGGGRRLSVVVDTKFLLKAIELLVLMAVSESPEMNLYGLCSGM